MYNGLVLSKTQYTQLNCVLEGMEYDGVFIPKHATMSGEIEVMHKRELIHLLRWDYDKKIWRVVA